MEVNRCNGTRRNKNKQIVEKNVRAQNFVTAIVAPYSHNIKLFSICLFSGRLVCTPNLSHTLPTSLFSTTSFLEIEFERVWSNQHTKDSTINTLIHFNVYKPLDAKIVSMNRWFYTLNANRIGCFVLFCFNCCCSAKLWIENTNCRSVSKRSRLKFWCFLINVEWRWRGWSL